VAVTNEEEFREWLESQPREVCVAIAYRAAMRVLPLATTADDSIGDIHRQIALAACRACLTAGAGARSTSIEVRAAADSAAQAASQSPLSSDAAAYAARSADSSDHAGAAWFAVDAALDASAEAANSVRAMDRNQRGLGFFEYEVTDAILSRILKDAGLTLYSMMNSEITVSPEINWAVGQFRRSGVDLLRADGSWAFWSIWYDRAMAGDPLPWDLQEQIALISNDIWEAGPDAVAAEIERIEAAYWAEHLLQAEEVVAREYGRFDVRPSVTADDKLMERIFRQTEFSLELSLNTNCGFSEMCVGFKLLRYTLDNLRDDPNSVEQNFRMARDIIAKKIASRDYDDHDALTVLVESLNQHALELRGQHSEVRAAYEVRVQQTLREIDDKTRIDVAEAMREFQREKAAGRLYEETGLDAETVESGAAIEAQATAIQRTGGRAAVARGLERASQAAKDVEASGGYKATRIGTHGYTIVDMLLKIFGG
jgi:hypothetical protein